ncbi:ArnT family glycosyltransferase [Nocardia sp. NPDC088792]|uniref:ArnT family glycosyltransferase n=1 Tax=Nocardia sp. NPDC088792 TaxID=3364332 RepID=UPI0037FF08BD
MTATLAEARPVSPPDEPPATRERRWEYPALALLLAGTAIAYIWNLSINGWANSFYAAAVQAGSVSWKAMFFGSSDAANSITVDKTPLSLWPMEISVRIFGLHSWSMLLPQALLGVGAVALLWAAVRKQFGPGAGLLAGLVLALTPIAAVMFRFNNPDAMLVFLMVAAAWAITKSLTDLRWRWILLSGLFVGLGFLTKQLQVFLVMPALALTYLIAGPPKLGRRIGRMIGAGLAAVAGAGWWLLVAEFWPAGDRPYFGGSQDNSILGLTFGYNGMGRLNGDETGSTGGGRGWGQTGILRLFQPEQAGQIAWLIPAALILLVAGLALRGRLPRTDLQRAGLVLWGTWLLGTGLTFSFMKGIFHPYYTVALAPAVAALVGGGSVMLWQHRDRVWVRLVSALTIGATTATAWILLSRTASFVPWLRWVILAGGIVATLALLIRLPRKAGLVVAALAVIIGLGGPTAYAVDGLVTAHQGAMPSAGPMVRGGWPGGPGGMPGRHNGAGGHNGRTSGANPGGAGNPGNAGNPDAGGKGGFGGGAGGFGGGAAGGVMSASNPSAAVTALLKADGTEYNWVAATVSSNSAAGFQLATQLPVMPVGGFNGTDPSPTLAQFQEDVQEGRIHYFITGEQGGGGGFGGGRENTTTQATLITQWVKDHFTATTVDGVTLYDLTSPNP